MADTCCKAVAMHVQLLDVFRCVERLSDTDSSSFRRLVQRDSLIAAVPRTDSLPAFKVDTRELLRRLPLHIMACILAQEPRENGARSPDRVIYGTRSLTSRALHVINPCLAQAPRDSDGRLSMHTGHDMQRHLHLDCIASSKAKLIRGMAGSDEAISWTH